MTLVLVVAGGLASCSSSEPQTFEKAAANATDALVAQTGRLPSFLARIEQLLGKPDPKLPRRSLILDPMLDTITGQQTETTALFERRVTQRIGNNYPQFEFLPFQPQNLTRAQYLLTGTMSREPGAIGQAAVRLSLALTDLKTGLVVAQASALAREENLDSTPLALLQRQPGPDQGQGRRGLRADDGDAGRPARRPVLPGAHRRGAA